MSRPQAWMPQPKGGRTRADALLRKYGISEEQVLPGEKTGGLLYFKGLTIEDANALIRAELLDPEESLEDSPNTTELLSLADQFPGIRFSGYRVLPPRSDGRITLTEVLIPSPQVERQDIFIMSQSRPIEFGEDDGFVFLAWH